MFRFLALLLLIAAGPALAGPLPATVAGALNDARIPATAVAIVVRPLDGATPLVEHNPDAPMNPASVMKLLTTYAALDLLGPAHTWATDAWIDAPAVDGVVDGNMYLQGSGSPRFVAEDLWNLLRRLRVRGIRHIAGDVVLDRGVFDVPRIDPGAFDAKPMRPYNVGPDGLLIDFQTLRFTLQPDLGRTRVLLETPNAVLVIDNRLRSSDEPCRSDWKDRIRTQLAGDGRTLEFSGHYPAACGEKTLNLAPLSADAQADGLIRALWRELGGTLAGRVRSGSIPAGAQRVARHESPPLADVVRDINKFSNNVMARQLFLTLGNDTAPATAERARARLAGWLTARRLDFPELVVDNGSGLSRSERISAGSLGRLLADAWRNPVMPEFMSSLPVVGVDGTMKKRLNGSPASGRAHIKSGSLEGVRSAAGYALDAQGRRYAVVCLINHPQAAAGGAAIDALLAWVARGGRDD